MVDDGFGNIVRDPQFVINNDGSMDFAGQTGYLTPSGARKWEYVAAGQEFVDVVSNVNYFLAPSTDTYVRLPQNPTHGDVIRFADVGGLLTFNVSLRLRAPNNVRIQGDGTNSDNNVAGLGSNYETGGELIIQTPNASLGLVYLGQLDYDGTSTGAPASQTGWWLLEI